MAEARSETVGFGDLRFWPATRRGISLNRGNRGSRNGKCGIAEVAEAGRSRSRWP
ncbi:hypothetical protein AM571_CH01824 [Rhizobium etli 8C-3]|uniref:Uncharacterized protein n=1 Tax=Rhizobium etli 8C-3 TaxID=538025 RepID=A0A1L5P399_RHIET|nr:hypothetical protein AM571_CH01824 [Rhizobium etli 8C-3]